MEFGSRKAILLCACCVTVLFLFLNSMESARNDSALNLGNQSLRRLESDPRPDPLKWFNNTVNTYTRSKPDWAIYEEIDGLKNEAVIMVVTSTAAKEEKLIRGRVIASSRTWMRMFANVLVVIEDTFEMRYAMRHCSVSEHPLYTAFKCHNEPTYLLSRNCSNEYYGAKGPCCKVDDAINWLVNVQTSLFRNIKYMLHSDDDMYWRPYQTLRWLAAVDRSGANTYPLIANAQIGDPKNAGVWHIKNCKEIHTTGWYQPAMMNHALLQKMAIAVANYGLRDTCRAFDVTHDVGLGVFAWMYAPMHIKIPNTNINGRHAGISAFKPNDLAMHCVKHHAKEPCDSKGWPHADKYNQAMAIGCGDIGQPSPGHNKNTMATMYEALEYYYYHGVDVAVGISGVNDFVESSVVVDKDHTAVHILAENFPTMKTPEGEIMSEWPSGEVRLVTGENYTLSPGDQIVRKVVPRLLKLVGYKQTNHSKKYDVLHEWVPFTLKDCNPPGTTGK